jgi:hypothetical protein
MEKDVMLGTNGARIGKSIGHRAQDVSGVLLAPLGLIQSRLYEVVCWFSNEWRLNATIRELNLLNDHCLDDIGLRRPFNLKTDDLMRRLRAGG